MCHQDVGGEILEQGRSFLNKSAQKNIQEKIPDSHVSYVSPAIPGVFLLPIIWFLENPP